MIKKSSPLKESLSKYKKIRKERAKSIGIKCNTILLYRESFVGNSRLPYTNLKMIKGNTSLKELFHLGMVILSLFVVLLQCLKGLFTSPIVLSVILVQNKRVPQHSCKRPTR